MGKFFAGFISCYLLAAALVTYEANQRRGEPLEAALKHGLAWGIRDVMAAVAPDRVSDWSYTK